MPVYEYTAIDEAGNEFSGTYSDVATVAQLRQELTKVGYSLKSANRVKKATKGRTKIKQRDVVAFAYRFAGMVSAGLPVTRCLETLLEQTEHQGFRAIIADIEQSIETGSNLTDAFRKHSDTFSDFFLGMLEAGETGGKLATSLQMSASYLEKQAEIKRKATSAFVYPIVVGIVCFIVVACLLVFVVPIFSQLYRNLHVPLPVATQALVDLSYLVRHWWWAILIVIALIAVFIRRLIKSPQIKAKWDIVKLKLPVFSKLSRMVVVSKFTRTFAMLASVGVSLVEALDVASVVANNHKMTEITKQLQQEIKAGNTLTKALKANDIFPPMLIQLASSGEQAGVLPDMLNKAADFLDKDIDRATSALLVKLEPALTLSMGVLIGLILLGVYLPLFDYMAYIA